jgi:hypothetical protein
MVVTSDASPYGVAGVLYQIIDGMERPVLFTTSTSSKTQQGFAQIE